MEGNMMHNRCLIITIIITVIIFKGASLQEVTLAPTTVDVVENSSVALTCSLIGNSSAWNILGTGPKFGFIFISNGTCQAYGFINDRLLYSWNCHRNGSFTLKFIKVDRSQHGNVWTCKRTLTNALSNNVVLKVKVPVENIEVITPSENNVTITENNYQLFICNTSYSRPTASVQWFMQIGDETRQINTSISVEIISDDKGYTSTISQLNKRVTRENQGAKIFCNGTNGLGSNVISRKITLRVFYAPNRGPYIDKAFNNSLYKLKENSNCNITCTIVGGYPPPKLSWNCTGTQFEFESNEEVGLNLQWQSKRDEDRVCTCTSTHVVGGNHTATIRIYILYSPTIENIKFEHISLNQRTAVKNTIRVIENDTYKLVCEAISKPEPSYKWAGLINSNVSTVEIVNPQTRRNYSETCFATNVMDISDTGPETKTFSRRLNVEILYPPKVKTMLEKRVKEGTAVQLTCPITPGNPAATSFKWTRALDNKLWFNKSFTIHRVSRNDTMTYTCMANNTMVMTGNINRIGSSSKSTLLKVLYPPSINSIKFEHSDLTNYISVDTTINVIENETYTLICEASSNPEPSYKWTGMENSTVSTIVIVNPQTRRNYTETCHATNAMNFTNQIQETVNVNRSVTVEILYPPTINSMVDKRVIEGSAFELKCPITHGNPVLTSFSWTRELDDRRWFKNLLMFDKVSRNDSMMYTCIANNTMVMTGNIKRIGTASKNVYMTVLYPPDKPTINLVSISKSDDVNITVTHKLIVFEHTPFTLSCKANSLPMSSYSWNPVTMSNDSVIQIPGITRNGTDEITCFVRNTMISSEGNSMRGNNNRTISIEKLFSPEIGYMNSITSEEGTNVDFVCPVKDGNPQQTHIMWTRNKDGKQWLRSKFTLENVSRTDSMTYTCAVNNTMVMTGGLIKHGKNNKSINLNVLYKVAVLNFIANNYTANHSVTLAENQLVNLTCEIEGNPAPEGSIFSSEALDVTQSTYKSHSIFSVTFKATCFHTGVYTCRGSNLIKQKEFSERDITLFITCSPRQNPAMPLQRNIKISKYEAVSINFTVLAYPEPTNILLNKHNGKSWIPMNDSDNYNITYEGVDIQFTILRVSKEDYGKYKLIIRNDYGKFEHVFYIEPAGMEAPASDSNPSVNYGLVAGLPVVIIIIITTVLVIGIILYRKRNTGVPDKLIYQNVPYTDRKLKAKQHNKPHQSVETYSEELQEIDDVPHYLSEPSEYYNSPEKIERIERIKVSELYSYVLEKSYESFGIDYEKLPSGLQKPCTFARKPENLPLNRYNGIYPYDHSRVKIPSCPDFFMNACYIDGYKRRNAYIASLGPTTKTTNDFQTFWQMVWHEETEVIVMLTNLNEPSGMKCEQYWPPGESCIDYGDISVKSKAIKVLAEYTIRTFHIIKDGRKRNLTHLHFTAWPDKTVPEDTTCLLEFRRRMKSIPTSSKGPIIVHCSAGIGRTGTLIAIDRLIEEGEDIGSVNVFECVEHMRSQRVKMVQTPEQYVYIYKALVNALVFGCETIPIGRFENYVTHNNDNFYSNQYKQLGKSVEKDKKEDADARAKNKRLVIYNRQGADVPGLRFRVMLCLTRQCGDHDYVNAVYINTHLKKDHVIVAQTPLPDTIEDFISMIYNENCTCVVTMEDLQEPGMMIGQYVSENKHPKSYGNFTVACSRLETKTQYIVRQMKIKYNADSSEKVAYHFQYTKWIPGQDTPVSAVEFLHFIEKVENYDNEFSDNYSHILVHCLKANERSGLYCAVKLLKEKIVEEREINVGNVLRHLRTRRQTAVTSMEQVKFCYQAVDAYIKMLK